MILPIFKNIYTPNKIICDLIQDLLKYLNFSEPSKFGVLKLRKFEYSIEYFISPEVNILEYSNIVLLKGDIKTKTQISSTEQSRSNIRGLRNLYIKRVNFFMGHPVFLTIFDRKYDKKKYLKRWRKSLQITLKTMQDYLRQLYLTFIDIFIGQSQRYSQNKCRL